MNVLEGKKLKFRSVEFHSFSVSCRELTFFKKFVENYVLPTSVRSIG